MPEFFSMLVVLQLFALEMAQLKGLNVDKPRNLAKSVTDQKKVLGVLHLHTLFYPPSGNN
ncbi:hypothetical protein HSHS1_11950 [Helicobacter suis HS1]|nr:hypothetical protein HSHS1_11950 [Helicobacter suis HS1]